MQRERGLFGTTGILIKAHHLSESDQIAQKRCTGKVYKLPGFRTLSPV
jgi:hypothetical protein